MILQILGGGVGIVSRGGALEIISYKIVAKVCFPQKVLQEKTAIAIFFMTHLANKDKLWSSDMKSATVIRCSSLHCYYFDL